MHKHFLLCAQASYYSPASPKLTLQAWALMHEGLPGSIFLGAAMLPKATNAYLFSITKLCDVCGASSLVSSSGTPLSSPGDPALRSVYRTGIGLLCASTFIPPLAILPNGGQGYIRYSDSVKDCGGVERLWCFMGRVQVRISGKYCLILHKSYSFGSANISMP